MASRTQAEAKTKQSIRKYLTIKNPSLVTEQCRTGKTTTSKHWTEPQYIRDWHDFNAEELERSFQELRQALDADHALQDFGDIAPFPFLEITDEHSLERLLSKWTQSVVCTALEVAQKGDEKIYMASGGQAALRYTELLNALEADAKASAEVNPDAETTAETSARLEAGRKTTPKYFPDWAAVRKNKSHAHNKLEAANLLPGDTKLSKTWDSENVPRGQFGATDYKKKHISPILQILNYCLVFRCRFGYIITDKELVAVHIKRLVLDKNEQPKVLKRTRSERYTNDKSSDVIIEIKSVPWNATDDQCLTVNLALWWLHLLADKDNAIKEEEIEPPVSEIRSTMPETSKIQGVSDQIISSFSPEREENIDTSLPATSRGKRKQQFDTVEQAGSPSKRPDRGSRHQAALVRR